MRLTEAQAKALGVTNKQIRDAKLTPPGARFVPQGTQKAPPSAFLQDGEGFEAMQWLREELEALYPGEVHVASHGLIFPRVKLRIEIDAWSQWSQRFAGLTDEFADWAVLRLSTAALKAKTRKLDVLQICTAYAEAEAKLNAS